MRDLVKKLKKTLGNLALTKGPFAQGFTQGASVAVRMLCLHQLYSSTYSGMPLLKRVPYQCLYYGNQWMIGLFTKGTLTKSDNFVTNQKKQSCGGKICASYDFW